MKTAKVLGNYQNHLLFITLLRKVFLYLSGIPSIHFFRIIIASFIHKLKTMSNVSPVTFDMFLLFYLVRHLNLRFGHYY